MPDGDSFGILVNELRAHGSRLDGLQERLSTALAAGREVALGDQAFGQICSFMVPVVHLVTNPGVEVIGQAATTMTDTAGDIRGAANTYETAEQGNTQTFTPGGNS